MKKAVLSDVELLPIQNANGGQGTLAVLEESAAGFPIKRVFYVYGAQAGTVRGRHAHKECRQVIVCVRGSCAVTCDDGSRRIDYVLDTPLRALSIPPMIWHEQKLLSPDAVLLVLADRAYDEPDYVRDYDEFLRLRKA
jgi:dTDP-4-dehydrorhamnose 3,5-epimerase-like enzyme